MNSMAHASGPASSGYDLLINGRKVAGASRLDVINPATGRAFATCARADKAQLDAAVAAAKAAFGAWSRQPVAERRRLLLEIADAMTARSAEFSRLLTEEQGKPIDQANGEIGGCVAMMRGLALMDVQSKVLRETPTQRIVQHHVPLGVVAAIVPWNFPILLLVLKVTPALLTGNTVVAKPAPTTPLTALLFGEMCAGLLPAGVLNIIVDNNDLGDALAGHSDVAKVAFTGSAETGRKVMMSCASTLKRMTLELGGNDAAIVLDDADVAKVAPKLFQGAMGNSGQVCVAVKRLYVPDMMYASMCTALAKIANETIVGDGLDPITQMGPIQNRSQYERVQALIEDSRTHGRIIAGGGTLNREGYFIAPTIVCDIGDNTRLVREEQFGPILPVLRYTNLDEAIERANDTDYGLGGSVWSSNLERAQAVALRLESGTICVNMTADLAPDVPLCGAKQSGFGFEFGQAGLQEYTQSKIINVSK